MYRWHITIEYRMNRIRSIPALHEARNELSYPTAPYFLNDFFRNTFLYISAQYRHSIVKLCNRKSG